MRGLSLEVQDWIIRSIAGYHEVLTIKEYCMENY